MKQKHKSVRKVYVYSARMRAVNDKPCSSDAEISPCLRNLLDRSSFIIHSPVSARLSALSWCIDSEWFVVSGDPLRLLGVRPEREADLHAAGRHAGEAAQTQP